jgi:hypothetical protein
MKKITFTVDVDDEYGDDDCIEQMKDDLERNLFSTNVGEVEFGFAQIKSFDIEHVK